MPLFRSEANWEIVIEDLTCYPDFDKELEIFVDADFAGGFDKDKAEHPELAFSRTCFIIKHTGFPIMWKSKLKTEIVLSTTEE